MGELIRSMDWSSTSLGPQESWPASLRTTLGLCLASNFPLCFIWGPDRIQFYNDGYWPLCAVKHPQSMGQDYRECWLSAWPVIGPNFERCITHGETTFVTDSRMFLDRSGRLEETFFTYSYSPIRDEHGAMVGVFHPVTETTHLVLIERRLRTARALVDDVAAAASVDEAIRSAVASLSGNPLDLPFVLAYRVLEDGDTAHLIAAAGVTAGSRASPAHLQMTEAGDLWCFANARASKRRQELHDIGGRFEGERCGPYDEAPHAAVVCPIAIGSGDRPSIFVVLGASACRPIDAAYTEFFAMVGDGVASAVSKAHAHAQAALRTEALAELDRAKTDFFSNVSHEFRTPLTLMLGPLDQILADGAAAVSPAVLDQLALVRRNGARLQKLVNTLLEFSRVEAGRVTATFRPVDLGRFTEQLCSMFRATIEGAGLGFGVACEPLQALPFVDRDMYESILLNLLSNAFKYTLQGRIDVHLSSDAKAVRLSVRDTGGGIAPSEVPRIFERFHRVRGVTGRSIEGSGIGLALTRDLVRQHGGSIEAESVQGSGTVITVRLPLGSNHLPAEQVARLASNDTPTQRSRAHLDEMRSWHAPGQAANDGSTNPSSPELPSVLLVDDNADMRSYICGMLADAYRVRVATDGVDALEQLRFGTPDIVLTDVMMPRLDGFGLVAALRANPSTASIPIIMLSARADDASNVEGLDAGADDYLVKPFAAKELRARLRTHIDLARLRRSEVRHTENERSSGRLELQARIFDTALSHTADFVYSFDLRGRFTYVNQPLLKLWNKGIDEVIGKTFCELDYPPELAERLQGQIEEVVRSRSAVRDETPYSNDQGTRDYEYIFMPVLGSGGQVDSVVGSTRDITERRQAVEALRDGDRKKDEFLAMLAHELRNPISAISNAALILSRSKRPESVAFASDVIGRQVLQFSRLVDDLLEVSRITTGKIRLEPEMTTVGRIFESVAQAVRPLMEERSHRFRSGIMSGNGELSVWADPARLQQVLTNLLINAAKYTPRGGEIEMIARRQDEGIVIEVSDNGIGMTPHSIESMFGLFEQGERAIDRAEGGLGIGLTVVRRLVELHGGTVVGRSAGPTSGSTFIVSLPGAPVSLPAEPAERVPGKAAEPDRASILVVDDNVDGANSLAEVLRALGHEVHVAHDGRAALQVASDNNPGIVLLDLGLPGMNGYQVAEGLRAGDTTRDAIIIAVSGYSQNEDRRRSAEAGFDHHLAKPVDFDLLLSLFAASGSTRGRAAADNPNPG